MDMSSDGEGSPFSQLKKSSSELPPGERVKDILVDAAIGEVDEAAIEQERLQALRGLEVKIGVL